MNRARTIFSLVILTIFLSTPVFANESALFKHQSQQPFAQIEEKLVESLENERLFVIFEANTGKNLAGFKKRWGDNYNRNDQGAIKSLLICNPWYANEVSNKDPDMLAFCPLRINMSLQDKTTSVLFIRPSQIFPDSKAAATFKELEETIIKAIQISTQ